VKRAYDHSERDALELPRADPRDGAAVQRHAREVDLELEVSFRDHVHLVELGAAGAREKAGRGSDPQLRERHDLDR
jgi:hypothetical protein